MIKALVVQINNNYFIFLFRRMDCHLYRIELNSFYSFLEIFEEGENKTISIISHNM